MAATLKTFLAILVRNTYSTKLDNSRLGKRSPDTMSIDFNCNMWMAWSTFFGKITWNHRIILLCINNSIAMSESLNHHKPGSPTWQYTELNWLLQSKHGRPSVVEWESPFMYVSWQNPSKHMMVLGEFGRKYFKKSKTFFLIYSMEDYCSPEDKRVPNSY